jgi:glutaredoxin 3
MKKVTVYTFEICPFCVQAKLMLQSLNVEFKEIELSRDELADFSEKTGMSTVPQIFFGDELIGGFTDLAALVQSGEVHNKLK